MRQIHKLGLLTLTFGITFAAAPAFADRKGRQVRYIDIHPIPKAEGGGLCYIEGPHVHIFPADKLQYRDHGGASYFVGDPVAYGYDGPTVTYKGHHPIHVHAEVGDSDTDIEFCYLDGPHFHGFAPPPDAGFEVRGDVNFYVAPPPPVYVEARPAMIKINAMYTPLVYTRPVVTVEAPGAWIGARAEFLTPVIVAPRAGVTVGADVRIPMPSINIGIGIGGGVIVRDRPVIIQHGKHKHKKWKGRGRWK